MKWRPGYDHLCFDGRRCESCRDCCIALGTIFVASLKFSSGTDRRKLDEGISEQMFSRCNNRLSTVN
jgi:hypothetical protein